MDDMKPERRPFQFSLRKLMLWMAVWAVCLAFFWSLVGTPLAAVVTLYVLLLTSIRLKWAFDRGCQIACIGTGVLFGCFGLLFFPLRGLFWCLTSGLLLGAAGFVLIDWLVRCVNSLDDWVQDRTQNR